MVAGKPLLDLIDDSKFKMMIKEILETRDFFEGTKEITDNGSLRVFKIFSKRLGGDAPGLFIDIADITPSTQTQNKVEKIPPGQNAFLIAMNSEPPFNGVRSYMPYGKVLVVDEGRISLDAIKNLMLPYGLFVDCIVSGREAVERIRNETIKYDVVFMDPQLPRIDGIEVIRIIRDKIGTEYAKNLPIVAVTVAEVDEDRFLAGGFNARIQKPIDTMGLDAILNQWVRDKQPEDTLLEAERAQMKDLEQSRNSLPGSGALEKNIECRHAV
jgi:CheY-like chemotaxis protein